MDQENRPRNRRWSKETVLTEISKLKEVSAKQNQRNRSDLYGAAVRFFGSWKNAVSNAGIDYLKARRKKVTGHWTEATILETFHKLTEKHSGYVRKYRADLYSAALRVFGSWEKTVIAAGLNYKKIKKEWRGKKKPGQQS